MSFRREPRTIDEKVAWLEEQLRLAQRQIVVKGEGLTASILQERGDLIVATDPGVASILAPGPDGSVLTADSSSATGLSYQANPGSMLAFLMDDA